MAAPVRVTVRLDGGLRREGSPVLLDVATEGITPRETLNADVTVQAEGRLQHGPVARALYEKGSSGDTAWPLF